MQVRNRKTRDCPKETGAVGLIICSVSDGDFKSHTGNLGICSPIYSLHRMLTVCWRLSKSWEPGSENGKQGLCLHSALLPFVSIISLRRCDHPALRDNSGGRKRSGGGLIVPIPSWQESHRMAACSTVVRSCGRALHYTADQSVTRTRFWDNLQRSTPSNWLGSTSKEGP